MRAYGVQVIEHADVDDIRKMASKSSVGKLPGPGGDYRPYSQGNEKARTRRRWKRKARAEGKSAIAEGCEEKDEV